MNEKEAIDRFEPQAGLNVCSFIEELYKQGCIILNPEELKKVDAMTTLAEAHGMNPFRPGGDKE